MALRKQVSESKADYTDPMLGVNLDAAEQDLKPGEARLMQNCILRGGTRIRTGSQAVTSNLFSNLRIRGGHKFYYGGSSPASKRLIAYGSRISHITDAGVETVINSGMASDLDTFFATWSISDKDYISNGTDTLRSYDGTTFATVTGTAIPTPRTAVVPVLDRLLAITTNGIERTSPRVDNVWSTNSSWATFRPSLVGLFTALYPFTVRGTDSLYPGAIAFQANAHYLITGTDYGSDASSATASADEDSAIRLLDPNVGTSSPYAVCAVPGVGLFWLTSDLNIYLLPEGALSGRYVGDKIRSNNSTAGLESINTAQLSQCWMAYFNRFLVVAFPTGSNTYADTQYWLDMRSLVEHTDRGFVWYGPMTGQTVGRAWAEVQQGNNAIYGGEGNPSTGAYLYRLQVPGLFTDAVGSSSNGIAMEYQPYFEDGGYPSREKRIVAVHLDLTPYSGTATVDLYDLDGVVAEDLTIAAV
jgi:hypothetical protein